MKEALEEGGVFANVNEEGLGRPAAGGLYDIRRESTFRERGSSSSPHGLAGDVSGKEKTQTGYEEGPSGDGARLGEPQRGGNRVQGVP